MTVLTSKKGMSLSDENFMACTASEGEQYLAHILRHFVLGELFGVSLDDHHDESSDIQTTRCFFIFPHMLWNRTHIGSLCLNDVMIILWN